MLKVFYNIFSKWCCVLGSLDEALTRNDQDLIPAYEELWPEGAIVFTNRVTSSEKPVVVLHL